MLSTKFQFIRESSFRGEDFFQKSTKHKQKWLVAAMFVNVSGRNWQYLQRTFHRCFLREDFKTSANQKQELPVAATFVNGSGQNEQSLQRTFHICFLPNFSSFRKAVSEEKIFQKSSNQKQEWPVAAMFVNGSELNEQILQRTFQGCFLPSFDPFGQINRQYGS